MSRDREHSHATLISYRIAILIAILSQLIRNPHHLYSSLFVSTMRTECKASMCTGGTAKRVTLSTPILAAAPRAAQADIQMDEAQPSSFSLQVSAYHVLKFL
jgi:hypothetical protein